MDSSVTECTNEKAPLFSGAFSTISRQRDELLALDQSGQHHMMVRAE
jgi:hypothetical protein